MTSIDESLPQPNLEEHFLASQQSNSKFQSKRNTTNNNNKISVKLRDFTRFATGWDVFLMVIGAIASFANGWALPLFSLIFGNMTKDITSHLDDLLSVGREYAEYFIAVGGVSWLLSYISMSTWMIVGERQAIRFRLHYFKSLLRQEISWYDKSNPNELSTKITNDCFSIQAAMGDKVSTFIYTMGNIMGGFAIAFYFGWKLALILAGCIIIPVAIAGGLFVYSMQKVANVNTKAYDRAGGYAEQAITEIRTVRSLNGEKLELENYTKHLDHVKKTCVKYSTFAGLSMGLIFFFVFSSLGLGLWYGSKLVGDPTSGYNTGKVVTIFFSLTNGMFSFAQITPCIKAFSVGKAALGRVMELLASKPDIDIYDDKGIKPEEFNGEIKFENVSFGYPMRVNDKVLNGFSIVIKANQKTALVGESGGGKSTCMQLIERFYDVEEGSVKFDDYDVRDLNLRWLRDNIGYVGQEPVLFATTIKENLLFGKADSTEEELIEATKKARAYEFIMKLEKGFETFVGPGGAQLSGGQKQRLAIARVLLKNPKILLLDEATSALDRKNEKEIQNTLDAICEGKTTIIIAHRISTVQNADNIILIDKGKAVDQGRHVELFVRNDKYRKIAEHQLAEEVAMSPASNSASDRKSSEDTSSTDFLRLTSEKLDSLSSFGNKENMIKLEYEDANSDAASSMMNTPLLPPKRVPKKVSRLQALKTRFRKKKQVVEKRLPAIEEDLLVFPEEISTEQQVPKTKDNKDNFVTLFYRLFNYRGSGKTIFVLMLIASLMTGGVLPTFAILFSETLDVLNNPEAPDYHSRSNFISLMFIAIAVGVLITLGLQSSLTSYMGESNTKVLRVCLYEKILDMDMEWYDKPENTPGTLLTRLSADTTLASSLISNVIGITIQSIGSLIMGVGIAFVAAWQVALVTVATTPLSLIGGYIQGQFNSKYASQNDGAYKGAGGFITEMIVNMRTVASFGQEKALVENYSKLLATPMRLSRSKGNKSGFIFGFTQFMMFGVMSLSFYVGIYYLSTGAITFLRMYMAIFALIFAAYGSGAASQYMTDLGSAKNAAVGIFNVLDYNNQINNPKDKEPIKAELKGHIEFKNVYFKYPSRNQMVLRGLNLTVHPGQKVAFVGPSGCGKSTILQLLLRYYDVQAGEILVDGQNIKDYDISYLRSQLGLVLQEPVLFRGTIEENIKYNNKELSLEQVKAAARDANALGFIESNQFECANSEGIDYGYGFNRKVGPKGSQLSGGQKQRIAIARSIIRNPVMYLFDEPTSALDSQNEQVIQESLDRITQGSTSITIAHRISTIKDADRIFVFLDGRIVEAGDYHTLVGQQGVFYKLEKGLPLDE